MNEVKSEPFKISQWNVREAYERVKANKGAAGVDRQSIKDFEEDLEKNLYKIWNRMASGTYFPPPVLRVEIPKDGGKTRSLGIPTVADRIAQMVAKMYLEPALERCFHEDSYGYRPRKSAHDALGITRSRCWKYNWVIDMDIKGFFDNIDHDKVLKAVKYHTDYKWIHLYVERWLKAPVQLRNGELEERKIGTPQGGVISPLLANLFLHYAFDEWMRRNHSTAPFARYADDIIVHCDTKDQAEQLLEQVKMRMAECGLELHPVKTKIAYCKDSKRRENHPVVEFDFLGYTFRPRSAKNRRTGKCFTSFLPAISTKAKKKIRERIKRWGIHRQSGLEINELAEMINPTVRGWLAYYGRFYQTELQRTLRQLNASIIRWIKKKYKRCKGSLAKAAKWYEKMTRSFRDQLEHWKAGILNGWAIRAV